MQKAYNRINWENYPSETTPINEDNLNAMDSAINEIDNRVVNFDTTKANATDVLTMISDVSYNEASGIFTFTRKNGATFTLDTKLEKLAINWNYDSTNQMLIITLEDGTKQDVDLSALIAQTEFADTDTVAFSVDDTGKVAANIKEGSIEEKHLQPNYLADVKVEVGKSEVYAISAEENATRSQSYAVGGTGTRENEDIDNAKYYMEQAKQISEIKGGLVPMGTITFSKLSAQSAEAGYMYNISDEFVTDSTFKDGAGYTFPAGTNVYLTADGYWDCLAGSPVTGIKGNAETSYRKGNVNITPANIGLGNVRNLAPEDMPISTATQTALDSVSEEMESVKKSASDGKSTIASAITAQGVSTSADATFATMATNINTVGTTKYNSGYNAGVSATKKGTATQAKVLEGVTFTSQNGVNLEGTMPNQGAVSKTITPSDSEQIYTIPVGYHNGNGKVTVGAAKSSGMTIKSLQNNRPAGAVTNNQTETNVVFDVSDFESLTIQSLAAAVYSTSLSYVSFTVDGTEVKRISDTSASNIVISLAGASVLKISMILVAQAANVHNYQTLTNLVFE